jgi:hypothetical protein
MLLSSRRNTSSPIGIFLKNCVQEVMASTVTAVTARLLSESVSASVPSSHGVIFAIAGFMIPNTANRQPRIIRRPVRSCACHSFFRNAINDFIFL